MPSGPPQGAIPTTFGPKMIPDMVPKSAKNNVQPVDPTNQQNNLNKNSFSIYSQKPDMPDVPQIICPNEVFTVFTDAQPFSKTQEQNFNKQPQNYPESIKIRPQKRPLIPQIKRNSDFFKNTTQMGARVGGE